jgi:hypothetical protein
VFVDSGGIVGMVVGPDDLLLALLVLVVFVAFVVVVVVLVSFVLLEHPAKNTATRPRASMVFKVFKGVFLSEIYFEVFTDARRLRAGACVAQ